MASTQTNASRSFNHEVYIMEKTQIYAETIDRLQRNEQETLDDCRSHPESSATKIFALCDRMLNLESNYLVLNDIHQRILNSKNEEALTEARKAVYKSVIYMESIVSKSVNVPFSDYEEKLAELAGISARTRYEFVRKLGFSITLLKDAFGSTNKWRWSFVDLDGRYAAVTKNLFALDKALENTDPRSPDYEPCSKHLALIKKLLAGAATQYRDRFEILTKQIADLLTAQNFLLALRYIHSMLGELDGAEIVNKQINSVEHKIALVGQAAKNGPSPFVANRK